MIKRESYGVKTVCLSSYGEPGGGRAERSSGKPGRKLGGLAHSSSGTHDLGKLSSSYDVSSISTADKTTVMFVPGFPGQLDGGKGDLMPLSFFFSMHLSGYLSILIIA